MTSGNWARVRNSSPAAATHTSVGSGCLSLLLVRGSRSSVMTTDDPIPRASPAVAPVTPQPRATRPVPKSNALLKSRSRVPAPPSAPGFILAIPPGYGRIISAWRRQAPAGRETRGPDRAGLVVAGGFGLGHQLDDEPLVDLDRQR